MPKLFDEFDLDIQKVKEINPMSNDGGNTLAQCDNGGSRSCGCTDSCVCPTYELSCWIKK